MEILPIYQLFFEIDVTRRLKMRCHLKNIKSNSTEIVTQPPIYFKNLFKINSALTSN